ncbi:hypothetical protein GQR58_016480 [Nymphon striatum]|nr:hypothetical protein GQR58_016480 [Nymphon striatum]
MVKKRQFSSSDEMDPEDINLETFCVVNELKVNQKHMQDDIDKLKLALVMTLCISFAVLDSVEEWLRLLKLDQYQDTLTQQGYSTVDHMTSVAWEDLEDIGIKHLGASVSTEMQYPYGYRTEQITVPSLHLALPVVAPLDNQNIPEFKTLQQSPTQCEMCYRQLDSEPSVPTHAKIYQKDSIHSPSRICSIEALNVMDYNNHNQLLFHSSNENRWYESSWRRYSFDASADSGEVTPTNEEIVESDYPFMGSNSLPRPKVLVKPRPVAKIMAKTLQSSFPCIDRQYRSNGTSKYSLLSTGAFCMRSLLVSPTNSNF